MRRFTGKTALITGAARGIGFAAAEQFALEGAAVIITDVDETALRDAVKALTDQGLAAQGQVQDVTDEAGWDRLIAAITAEHGGLDILVNNAGIGFLLTIEETSVAQWRRVMQVNLEAVFLGTRAGITAMKTRGGVIINVASIASKVAEPLFPAYNASKGGVALFTKAAAVDCARKGYPVRINMINPGYCETKLVADAVGALGDGAAAFAAQTAAAIPLGRLATPFEIARPLLFLASDDAAYMVGSELVVDGGYIAI